jgi:hypothetical protein
MKKHLLLSLLFALSMNSFCQQRETAPTLTKQDYLQKSKKQKTTAWILLAGGTTVGFIGLTKFNFAGSEDPEFSNTPATVMFFSGIAVAITSIPFFNASKKNKRRAAAISIKNQFVPNIQSSGLVYKPTPCLVMRVNL